MLSGQDKALQINPNGESSHAPNPKPKTKPIEPLVVNATHDAPGNKLQWIPETSNNPSLQDGGAVNSLTGRVSIGVVFMMSLSLSNALSELGIHDHINSTPLHTAVLYSRLEPVTSGLLFPQWGRLSPIELQLVKGVPLSRNKKPFHPVLYNGFETLIGVVLPGPLTVQPHFTLQRFTTGSNPGLLAFCSHNGDAYHQLSCSVKWG
ncbi:hypothetical protein ACH5RR_018038 [Cinchona calisaya]|uniref:Uncharacterized protein n=1 Tax=Cinchona calisaya TaxID=153742 RepID=A0ABD2ZL80_9GENT